MKDKADAVKCLYRQRDKFILIGLTGRTGAGCTTVAKILSTDNINELDLKIVKHVISNILMKGNIVLYIDLWQKMKDGKNLQL